MTKKWTAHARQWLLCAALVLPGSASATSGPINQLQDAWAFVQQLQTWAKSFTDLKKMKDDLFGQIDYKDLGMRLANKALASGLKLGGVDLGKVLGPLINNAAAFQAKIDALRDQIKKQVGDTAKLAFLDNYDRGTEMEGTIALNPDMVQMRMNGGNELAAIGQQNERSVQDVATSSQIIEQSKTTIEDAKTHGDTTVKNAGALTLEAKQIQSTREGVQLLVRAQAENIMNTAYSTTAITTSLSQVARQTQVSNNMLSEMVGKIMDDRRDNALAAIRAVRTAQAEAGAMAERTSNSIDMAADGISKTFATNAGSINVNQLF